MHSLTKKQTQQFRIAIRKSNSQNKLMAKDLVKLKTPLFKDYLLHVKRYAGTPNLKKQRDIKQSEQQYQIKPNLIRNNSSYYYCEKNQLLSLKQFVILMEQSKKRTLREQRAFRRLQQRRLAQSVQRQLQKSDPNKVNLRLTSSYAKRFINGYRRSIN